MRTLTRLVTLILLAAVGFSSQTPAMEGEIQHYVPADKGLSDEWKQQLFERGEPAVWTGEELKTIGMPVGGIAAGQLYLLGDGALGLWRIFNKHIFTGYGRECYRTERPEAPIDSGFAVALHSDGGAVVKRLSREDFSNIEFIGEYPIGLVRYEESGFPVEVQMEVFSPFIPLNAHDSALPATVFEIKMTNTSDHAVQCSLLGWLENAVCFHSAEAIAENRRSRLLNDKDRALMAHTIEKAPPPKEPEEPRPTVVLADFEGDDYGDWTVEGEAFGDRPATGTLPGQQDVTGYKGEGLVNTFLGGDDPQGVLTSPAFEINRTFINFLIGGGDKKGETCINLLVDGEVARTSEGQEDEELVWDFWNVEDLAGKDAVVQIVDRASGGWGHINIDHIELADQARKASLKPLPELEDYGSMALTYDGKADTAEDVLEDAGSWAETVYSESDMVWKTPERRSMAMSPQPMTLQPGEEKTHRFVLSWFFPNHEHGREYANRFEDAPAVAHYVLDHYDRLAGETRKWARTYYEDSNLPRWLLFRLHSTVANLATGTCQWWRNGRFWAWEGVGCCQGTCTHVWNYAHAPARLFPELERSARSMQDFGAGFDEETGLVGFRSNRAYAADGQCGTVLKAYREHTMSADDEFLKEYWPRIKKALQFSIEQDGNDDGLIETSQHNTYDIEFHGPNTFVGALYLGALRAGEEMAREVGDEAFAEKCRKIYESGRKNTSERLFDGEYFIQDVDQNEHPRFQYARGCLSDQLFGQGWAHHIGLGYLYPVEQVRSALASVYKYNWAPDVGPQNKAHPPERVFARPGEAGLFTSTWPKTPTPEVGVRYRNEVWTGIEYQVAGGLVWEGMLTEALAICRGIHERYDPAKHNPFNEVECGDHYARAMASWGVYTALSGYEYHGPDGHIGFDPRLQPDDHRSAFTAAEGWGLFAQKRSDREQSDRIEVRYGQLKLNTVSFQVSEAMTAKKVVVQKNDEVLDADVMLIDGRINIELAEPVLLKEGDALTAHIQ